MKTITKDHLIQTLGVPVGWVEHWLGYHWKITVPEVLNIQSLNALLRDNSTGFNPPLTVEQLVTGKVKLVTLDEAFALWAPLGHRREHFAHTLMREGIPQVLLRSHARRLSCRERVLARVAFHSTHFHVQTLTQLIGGRAFLRQLQNTGLQSTDIDGVQLYRRAAVAEALGRAGFLFNCQPDTWLGMVLRDRKLTFLSEASHRTHISQAYLRHRLTFRNIPYIDNETPRFPEAYFEQLVRP